MICLDRNKKVFKSVKSKLVNFYIMDRVTAMPHEIELELIKFELKISKLNKEEMFKELMLLKFDSENNFYFIKKYLSKHGMKISRQIIQRHNTDHIVIAFGYLSEKMHKLFKKTIFPEVKLESQRLIDLIINNRSTKKVRIDEKN